MVAVVVNVVPLTAMTLPQRARLPRSKVPLADVGAEDDEAAGPPGSAADQGVLRKCAIRDSNPEPAD